MIECIGGDQWKPASSTRVGSDGGPATRHSASPITLTPTTRLARQQSMIPILIISVFFPRSPAHQPTSGTTRLLKCAPRQSLPPDAERPNLGRPRHATLPPWWKADRRRMDTRVPSPPYHRLTRPAVTGQSARFRKLFLTPLIAFSVSRSTERLWGGAPLSALSEFFGSVQPVNPSGCVFELLRTPGTLATTRQVADTRSVGTCLDSAGCEPRAIRGMPPTPRRQI